MKSKILHKIIIGIFVSLYLVTSTISTIHSIDFFQLANSYVMSIFLAVAFELGAAASLGALVIRGKMNMFLVWSIFIVLTLFQIMNNVYFSFMHLGDFSKWSELFGLNEEDILLQKRIVSIALGAVLPLIALGFIKALVDYIKPSENTEDVINTLNEPLVKDDKTIKSNNLTQKNKPEEELTDVKNHLDKLPKEFSNPIHNKNMINGETNGEESLSNNLENSLDYVKRVGM